MEKKLISIVSPTYNESENIDELYLRLNEVTGRYEEKYNFEFLIIDNASIDGTQLKLRALAEADSRVKLIFNNRNFGHIRSPYWGLIQANGDAIIYLASDLQDPPELISEFIEGWERGYKVVMATKPASEENKFLFKLRKYYYSVLNKISDSDIIQDATGFGLYDKEVIEKVRIVADPYPFLRGMIAEFGYDVLRVPFNQPKRLRGITKNNFFTLYDIGMLSVVSHSAIPMRVAAILGFTIGILSFAIAILFLVLKMFMWNSFPVGIAPIVIGLFFMFGIVLTFIGLLGEYVITIHRYIRNLPVVVEKERINY